MAGTEITCPNCHTQTILTLPDSAAAPTPASAQTAPPEPQKPAEVPPEPPSGALPLEELLGAFQGNIRQQGTSFVYQIGLLLVTAAIVMLPVLYLALVILAGYGVYWWATEFSWLLGGVGGRAMLAKFTLYATPLFAGCVVLFFMVKPLLARVPPGAQPLALNPENEPALFCFVAQICERIGAPFPSRIDVDCELNASASFRGGFRSLLGNDLVLTLGLPLVAGVSVTQLAGVIAHEFGHFNQRFAMRLNYIVRRVSGWFARVIYERDEWDVRLDSLAAQEGDWRVQIIVGVARLGVWFSRLVLKGLMLIGAGISSFVSRQMEYDADHSEIQFVGSRCFEETTIRFATLGESMGSAFKQMHVSWRANKALPDCLPQFIALHDRRMPNEKRVAIADRVGLERAGLFSTHPASGDRIRRARQADAPGLFALEQPATRLFENFDILAQQVTLLHYTDDLDIPPPLITLRPANAFFESTQAQASVADYNAARDAAQQALGPSRLKLKAE